MINRDIPPTSGEVRDKLLRFKEAGPTVEEARAAMLASKEEATTIGGGTRVPSFISAESQRKGQVAPASTGRSALASARDKLSQLRVPPGSRVNLKKMLEAGLLTQLEIDALMADANGTPAPAPAPVEESAPDIFDVVEPVAETASEVVQPQPERVPLAPAPAPAPVAEAPVSESSSNDRRTRHEDKNCTVEMFRDGREWVAELSFKNGAGTERFTATSKDELLLKLAIGKANASLKVRDTVRRMKLGDKPDGWDYFFKQIKESHNLTVEQYNALPEESRALAQDLVQAQQIIAFKETYPNYYATDKNFKYIAEYLNNREWPLTLHNLELAYSDLTEDEILELRPKPVEHAPVAPVQSSAPTVVPTPEDSVVEAPTAPAAPAAPAVAPNAPVVRRKVLTGLVPGSSSASPSGTAPKSEEVTAPAEPSLKELKNLSDAELKRIATQHRVHGRIY